MKLTREDFQSPTYQQAGYGAMPERYGTSDRYVHTLEYADGTQLIIMGGKFAPARRLAGDPALNPMADNRESSTIIYKYNGKNMTTERLPNGKVNRITGKLGRPGGLLPLLRALVQLNGDNFLFYNKSLGDLNVEKFMHKHPRSVDGVNDIWHAYPHSSRNLHDIGIARKLDWHLYKRLF
jgi:hypothetical protein